jgi:hypothetical protein
MNYHTAKTIKVHPKNNQPYSKGLCCPLGCLNAFGGGLWKNILVGKRGPTSRLAGWQEWLTNVSGVRGGIRLAPDGGWQQFEQIKVHFGKKEEEEDDNDENNSIEEDEEEQKYFDGP